MENPDDKRNAPVIDLHPSEWHRGEARWQPKIGNDPQPGKKPHIWQEWERDMNKPRYSDEPIIGRGWPILAIVLAIAAVQFIFEMDGGPEWIIAIKGLF